MAQDGERERQSERQSERVYVLYRFDGHSYDREDTTRTARSPEDALEAHVSDNKDDAGKPFLVIPERFTALRRKQAQQVTLYEDEVLSEEQIRAEMANAKEPVAEQ